jgi:hypothetical protein
MAELAFFATRPGPYVARSASDRADDWPNWYVHGADGVNCVRWRDAPLVLFIPREVAQACANALNARDHQGELQV